MNELCKQKHCNESYQMSMNDLKWCKYKGWHCLCKMSKRDKYIDNLLVKRLGSFHIIGWQSGAQQLVEKEQNMCEITNFLWPHVHHYAKAQFICLKIVDYGQHSCIIIIPPLVWNSNDKQDFNVFFFTIFRESRPELPSFFDGSMIRQFAIFHFIPGRFAFRLTSQIKSRLFI